jgi:hypothetical protein
MLSFALGSMLKAACGFFFLLKSENFYSLVAPCTGAYRKAHRTCNPAMHTNKETNSLDGRSKMTEIALLLK